MIKRIQWRGLLSNYLVFVKFASFVLLFTFLLKCDNDETDEDIHHEEGDDNNIRDVEDSHDWPGVVHFSMVLCIRVNRPVKEKKYILVSPGFTVKI